ncbi:MAG: gliding motility protein GldL [Bacteroidales bacterium]|nr:gliding motility protein GldL [Bacteroidales bacterium]
MAKYSRYNIIYLLQKWMESVAGQTFMNYAYSWGASIVILGTLFKLTHLPGANIMLYIGMGTEVFVFFIAAFDRPFDKTSDGKELTTDSQFAAELNADSDAEDSDAGANLSTGNGNVDASEVIEPAIAVAGNQPQTIVFGQLGGSQNVAAPAGTEIQQPADAQMSQPVTAAVQGGVISVGAPAPAVTPETAVAMEEATTTYVDRLNELNELLLKVGAQSERLTTDSEEMENLNRTLTGIARIYELQLKAASQQVNTQDEINDQTRKLAQQIAELNAIYARMIEAMSVNMK